MTIATHTMIGGARYYPCPLCKNEHPSVTTVLDVIGSPALMGWAAKNGTAKLKQYALEVEKIDVQVHMQAFAKFEPSFWKNGQEQAKDAADYGTIAHAAFEMALKGLPVDKKALPEPSRNAYGVFEGFMASHTLETEETEKTFYNCRMGYAGTTDWLGKIDGKLTSGDHKTSSGIFEKQVIQAWANAISDEMQNGSRLYQQVGIFRFGKDGTTDILLVERNGRITLNGEVRQESGYFGSYEQARTLIEACVNWFHYKKDWEASFPYIRKKIKS